MCVCVGYIYTCVFTYTCMLLHLNFKLIILQKGKQSQKKMKELDDTLAPATLIDLSGTF